MVTIFCFCCQKVVFILFSNFGFKYCFLPVSIHFFCLVIVFNREISFITVIYFIPSIFISFPPYHIHTIEPVRAMTTTALRESQPVRTTPQSQKQDSLTNPSLLQSQKTHLKNPTSTNLERRSWHGVVERQSRSGVVTGGGILGSAISGTFLTLSSLGFILAGFWINGVR